MVVKIACHAVLPSGEAAAKRPRLELGQAADDGGSDAAQQQGAGASSAAGAASSGAAADTGAAAAAARLRVGAVTPLEDFRAMVAAGR